MCIHMYMHIYIYIYVLTIAWAKNRHTQKIDLDYNNDKMRLKVIKNCDTNIS